MLLTRLADTWGPAVDAQSNHHIGSQGENGEGEWATNNFTYWWRKICCLICFRNTPRGEAIRVESDLGRRMLVTVDRLRADRSVSG
jgi:hypothetical protein